jgi:ABC-2 type transport system permease protein
VVAHLVRLKLALLRNIFRRSRAQTIGAVAGTIYFSVLVAGLTLLLAALRTTPDAALVAIPLAGAVGMVLWTVVPLFSFGSDPTLDPARFAVFAVPPRDLAVGLIAAALVGLPAIASSIMALGIVVAWSHTLASTLTALVATAVGVLTAVTVSRWVTALASAATTSRRGRDVLVVAGVVMLVVVGPAIALAANVDDVARVATTVSRVVAWSPLGWAWAAPGDVATGRPLAGALRLTLAVALLVGALVLWTRAVRRQVERPHAVSRSDAPTGDPSDLGLFAHLPDRPDGAVAARVLTYWRRDPRYQVSLFMTPVFPLAVLVPYVTNDVAWAPLLLGPVLAFFLGFSEHNCVAYEADAFWLHLASGTRGRADRLGRLVPLLLLGGLLVPLYAVVGVAVADRWDLLPAELGLSIAVLGAGAAVSSALSILVPYPVPAPGENPFSAPPGAAGVTVLAQTLASTATMALASPVVVLAWFAWSSADPTWAVWATGVVGILFGPFLVGLGLRVGATLYERRAPELLATLQRG